ncbi:MAG: 30S ribosomal protein S2 [Candidatus Lokiarchaeota archaeon]|nr:30S ribosomal protein S2 [Candidatus Lokiarchaeota archaeon]
MAKKKKKTETTKDSEKEEETISEEELRRDFEKEFEEDFEDELDLEEELELLDTEDMDTEVGDIDKLVDKDEEKKQMYLSCGIHIGTKLLSGDARRFIYRQTNYGLYVIDLTQTDKRLMTAAKFLSKYVEEGSDKVIVSSVRRYGKEPVKQFCKVLGCRAITERFIPGSLTNPIIDDYIKDASVVVIVDPHADKVILREAKLARIPVVSLFDTDDILDGIDLAIPANNRGKKALGLAFWLLARQILLELGKISSEDDFPYTLDEFTSNIVPVYRQE